MSLAEALEKEALSFPSAGPSSIDLSSQHFHGTIPSWLCELTSLHSLNLNNNRLEGTLPPELAKLYSLEVLHLHNNRLEGPIPSQLSQLNSLKKLSLRSNQFSGSIPPQLGQLASLVRLDLSDNQLSGPIPTLLTQLTSLTSLYLSSNQLSGPIPTQLSKLTSLKELYLSDNRLSGLIPAELGELTSLAYLYLRGNPLCGTIPPQLIQLIRRSTANKTLLNVTEDPPFPVTSAHYIASFTPQLSQMLEQGKELVGRVNSKQKINDLHELSESSVWRFWITVCYWLMGQDLPDELSGWNGQWLKLGAREVRQVVQVAHTLMVESYHGNILHLVAHFGLNEEAIEGILVDNPVAIVFLHRQDHHGRTPLQIVRYQRTQEPQKGRLSEHQEQLVRCQVRFQQLELLEAKAKQERVQLEYTHEDALLYEELEGITITRHSACIVGHLLQCVHELEQHLQDHPMHAASKELFFRCASQLKLATDLYWKGPQHNDPQVLRDIKRSMPYAAQVSNKIRAIRAHIEGAVDPPHTTVLRMLCASLSTSLVLPAMAKLLQKRCAHAYNQALAWCRMGQQQPTARTWVHDVDLGSVILKEQAARKLMPDGVVITEMENGHHAVITYGGMHFKILKDSFGHAPLLAGLPGIEYMVDRLTKLVVGHGTAPSRLVKITKGSRQLIMQVALSVAGETLKWVLTHHPTWIEKLDERNASEITLIGLLTNPRDGKPDNFMVEVEYEEKHGLKEVKRLHLVGIDNDMAFADPIRQFEHVSPSEEKDFHTQVLNVVFLLPTMDRPIHPDSRDHFLALSPDLTLLEWLKALEQRNRKYEALREQNIFTQEDYQGDPGSEGLQLPITIPDLLIKRLYHTMVKMQNFMRQHPSATLHDIFADIQPALATAYHSSRLSGQPILEQVDALYDKTMREHLGDIKKPKTQDERQRMYSFLIYEAHKAKETVTKLSVDEAAKQLLCCVPVKRIDVLLNSKIFDHVPLPDATDLMHTLLSQGRLTLAFLGYLLSQGADLQKQSDVRGRYPVQLAVASVTPWVVDLVQELVDRGSPSHLPCESGTTEEMIRRYIADKDQQEKILMICCGDGQ